LYEPNKKRSSPIPQIDLATWDQYKEAMLWLHKEQEKTAKEVLAKLKADGSSHRETNPFCARRNSNTSLDRLRQLRKKLHEWHLRYNDRLAIRPQASMVDFPEIKRTSHTLAQQDTIFSEEPHSAILPAELTALDASPTIAPKSDQMTLGAEFQISEDELGLGEYRRAVDYKLDGGGLTAGNPNNSDANDQEICWTEYLNQDLVQ